MIQKPYIYNSYITKIDFTMATPSTPEGNSLLFHSRRNSHKANWLLVQEEADSLSIAMSSSGRTSLWKAATASRPSTPMSLPPSSSVRKALLDAKASKTDLQPSASISAPPRLITNRVELFLRASHTKVASLLPNLLPSNLNSTRLEPFTRLSSTGAAPSPSRPQELTSSILTTQFVLFSERAMASGARPLGPSSGLRSRPIRTSLEFSFEIPDTRKLASVILLFPSLSSWR
mmetsp:Transcript_11024/g.19469  ORF Transcript_11024/g.19469 Transcript_11024/m.19469 type:complete len:232 (+) Transcript_11024:15-710(+)